MKLKGALGAMLKGGDGPSIGFESATVLGRYERSEEGCAPARRLERDEPIRHCWREEMITSLWSSSEARHWQVLREVGAWSQSVAETPAGSSHG